MKPSIGPGGAGALVCALLASVVSCSAGPGGLPGESGERAASSAAAIQGGTTDSTHQFAVGIVQLAQLQQNMVAFCSGVLLTPNLVATARHCVAELTNTTIDCSTSKFGALYPASDVRVTTETTIPEHPVMSDFYTVSKVIVPTGAGQDLVCGNDIALLVLDTSVPLPAYVTPVIDPPMTDPQFGTKVTAIGYGITTPTDTTGATAGTRRAKSGVDLLCVPNDPNFIDCFSDPQARTVLTAGEFVSGDSTCEGDSGSGAFEQTAFDQGDWVAFGVLSRGGVSTDGKTCEQPIYTRFDAWGPLIVDAAKEAQTAAGHAYALPAWAGGSSATAGGSDGSAPLSTSTPTTGLADGMACTASSECLSSRCAVTSGSGNVCASPCQNGTCASGFSCQGANCMPNGASGGGGGSGGCAVAPGARGSIDGAVFAFGAVALGGLAQRRRRASRGSPAKRA